MSSLEDVSRPVAVDWEAYDDCISDFLNQWSVFSYMMNSYITTPTAAEYAAVVGGGSSAAGIVLMMTPLGACVACVAYSAWANRSFTQPFMACFFIMTFGNLFYALAPFASQEWRFHVALAGRMLIGLGSSRSISRRYVVDTSTTPADITARSGSWITFSALGMAVGPIAGAMLSHVNFVLPGTEHLVPGGVVVDQLTAPGWLMALLSLFSAILFFFFFKNPDSRIRVNEPETNIELTSGTSGPEKTSGAGAAAAADAAVNSSPVIPVSKSAQDQPPKDSDKLLSKLGSMEERTTMSPFYASTDSAPPYLKLSPLENMSEGDPRFISETPGSQTPTVGLPITPRSSHGEGEKGGASTEGPGQYAQGMRAVGDLESVRKDLTAAESCSFLKLLTWKVDTRPLHPPGVHF